MKAVRVFIVALLIFFSFSFKVLAMEQGAGDEVTRSVQEDQREEPVEEETLDVFFGGVIPFGLAGWIVANGIGLEGFGG